MSDAKILFENNEEAEETKKPNQTESSKSSPVFGLQAKFASRSKTLAISEEARRYISEFERLDRENKTGFDIKRASGNIDSIFIINPVCKEGILVGFSETNNGPKDLPAINVLNLAKNQYIADGYKVVNSFIIGPEDYGRSSQLYQYVSDVFDIRNDSSSVRTNLKEFSSERCELVVSFNPADARDFISRHSVHATLPHFGVGLTFKIRDRANKTNSMAEPIAAVVGYTDFIHSNQFGAQLPSPTMIKYTPMFHISEIHSLIADPAFLAFLIPITWNIVCDQKHWLYQFDNYGDTRNNIGSLINDPESNNPWKAKDPQERNQFLGYYFTTITPAMVIDLQIGRAQLPMVDFVSSDKEQVTKIYRHVSRFLNDPKAVSIFSPSSAKDYTGVLRDGNGYCDSRSCDYLYLVNKSLPRERISLMLNYYNDPKFRSKQISEWFPGSFDIRYINHLMKINPEFLRVASVKMKEYKVSFVAENRSSAQTLGGIFDVSNMMSQVNMADFSQSDLFNVDDTIDFSF